MELQRKRRALGLGFKAGAPTSAGTAGGGAAKRGPGVAESEDGGDDDDDDGGGEEGVLAHGDAIRLLEKSLRPLGIAMTLPEGHLVPRIPNRLNYVRWLALLLSQPEPAYTTAAPHILDVGTGASAVYPLLGSTLYGWRFTGSDLNASALDWARRNVQANNKSGDIALVQPFLASEMLQLEVRRLLPKSIAGKGNKADADEVAAVAAMFAAADRRAVAGRGPVRVALAAMGPPFSDALASLEQQPQQHGEAPLLAAVMSNPPFYDTTEPIPAAPPSTTSAPASAATVAVAGSQAEMRTSGGEAAFVAAMILDSLVLQGHVGWFTCLLGKKKSLGLLLRLLRALGVGGGVTCVRFAQGRTHRWGLAWTFRPELAARILVPASASPPAFSSSMADDGDGDGGLALALARSRICLSIAACGGLEGAEILRRLAESFAAQGLPEAAVTIEVGPARAPDQPGDGQDREVWFTATMPGAAALPAAVLDRLKGDTERVNRFWRRRLQRLQGGGGGDEMAD